MSDDPAIFYTTAFGMTLAAFAFLRTLAGERQQRIALITSTAEAQRAHQEQQNEKK